MVQKIVLCRFTSGIILTLPFGTRYMYMYPGTQYRVPVYAYNCTRYRGTQYRGTGVSTKSKPEETEQVGPGPPGTSCQPWFQGDQSFGIAEMKSQTVGGWGP